MTRVLHADFISLAPGQTEQAGAILSAASDLRALPGVEKVLAVEGEEEGRAALGIVFLIDDLASLEAFGTDQRYTAFLQKVVAPALGGLAGIDARIEGGLDESRPSGACLALNAPPHAYDWEVKAALESWQERAGAKGIVGLAVGERQRFRGIGIIAGDAPPMAPTDFGSFGITFVSGSLSVLA